MDGSYQEQKKEKYIIIALLLVSFFIVFKEIIFKKQSLSLPFSLNLAPNVDINVRTLEDKRLKELVPFERLSFPEEIGRNNPFLPVSRTQKEVSE
jgi:hypothetical protein